MVNQKNIINISHLYSDGPGIEKDKNSNIL